MKSDCSFLGIKVRTLSCLVQTKRQLQWFDENLDGELYSLCFQSETKALLSYSSRLLSFNASACSTLLTHEEKTFRPTAGIKTSLPLTSSQKGTEEEACDRPRPDGRWQERIQTGLSCGSSSQFSFSLLAAFQFHSLFQ